jgi:hypothetical protein
MNKDNPDLLTNTPTYGNDWTANSDGTLNAIDTTNNDEYECLGVKTSSGDTTPGTYTEAKTTNIDCDEWLVVS